VKRVLLLCGQGDVQHDYGPAERFWISQPAITYAVRRGQKIVQDKGYGLIER
jgi:hypothetical protein